MYQGRKLLGPHPDEALSVNMPPESLSVDQAPAFTNEAGAGPGRGDRWLGPVGGGGFGEVWKGEGPGGLCKAIKSLIGRLDQLDGGGSARQELDALKRVKNIRHPFVLSMERVEI